MLHYEPRQITQFTLHRNEDEIHIVIGGMSLASRIFSKFNVLFLFVAVLVILYPILESKRKKYVLSNNLNIMLEAVETSFKSQSSIGLEIWNKVTKRMNALFYSNCKWKTPYFSFNAMETKIAFKKLVLYQHYSKFSADKDGYVKNGGECHECSAVEIIKNAAMKEYILRLKEFSCDSPVGLEKPLPKELHKNRFIWRLKQTVRGQWYFLFSILAAMSIAVLDGFSISSMIFLSYDIYTLWVPLCYSNGLQLNDRTDQSTNYIIYCATIKTVAPGDDMDRLDIVARLTNLRVCEECSCTLDNCFFDGKDCKDYFKLLAKP